ncbi:NAD(P)H oxidoreductase [Paenibacillus agilis]|uniref:NAD(P)H oxidoreductase n=1 Tax=Paenibacillus agilis TaxID=3020863 RepID=A0A559J0M4_9BACL|nr:NAD(P)H oxidoreductase [Paenibacillus agilis]TVX93393.1 NAD(P)H oxidoreductase [Paenibacillus agilis]
MKALVTVTHPRKDSLTYAVMDRFVEGLKQNNHEIDLLHLDHDGFDPIYTVNDEKDWMSPDKIYSPEVRKEMDRIAAADTLIYVFPLWQYSVPSMLKAYLDKIWNMGLFGKMGEKKVLWICLTGGDQAHMLKYKREEILTHYLNVLVSGYARVKESKVELLHDTLSESKQHIESLLDRAYQLGLEYK